jgi:pyruvate/2-oxoglutarate dehydrogenase complex dihydrolipoamide dehydrogenase (E3) component
VAERLVKLDAKGFVRTGTEVGADSPFATSQPGIFAVGDVRSGSVKRVASSVGEGSVVMSKVWESLIHAIPRHVVVVGIVSFCCCSHASDSEPVISCIFG